MSCQRKKSRMIERPISANKLSLMASGIPPQHPILAALASKLDEMTLHDETGDPHDEGYMTAVREMRGWLG
jgi:hypothetical protein